MTDTGAIKQKTGKSKRFLLVRYGQMNNFGLFEHNENQVLKTSSRVVVKTERGLELGTIVGSFCAYRAGQLKLDIEQLQKYFLDSEIILTTEPSGKFVRYATAEDISEEKHFRKIAAEEMKNCENLVKEMNLPMKIVNVEHIFGGERIIFYFMSDGRVDFRELVKKLAHDYQSRIEMRQIGSRDEAKILGDIETCGQECCCIRFLKVLKPVNMRMAKMQKATLDPSKISGFCGRLKCCLRYEDLTYLELKKRLPKKRTKVKTKYGVGFVVDGQILTQLVVVELESQQTVAVPLEEIEILEQPGPMPKRNASQQTEANGTEEEDYDQIEDKEPTDQIQNNEQPDITDNNKEGNTGNEDN
jgi:cell fate regulator YaaT (PSP1 superfamily)